MPLFIFVIAFLQTPYSLANLLIGSPEIILSWISWKNGVNLDFLNVPPCSFIIFVKSESLMLYLSQISRLFKLFL